MKYISIAFLVITISSNTIFSQIVKPSAMKLRYKKLTEFVFNEKKHYYLAIDTIEFSGTILTDSNRIIIEGCNNKPDKIFKIVKFEKEEVTNRDLFTCELNGETFAIAISPDKKYLTQIGLKDKYVYELDPDYKEKIQFKVIEIDTNEFAKEVFFITTLEVKPIFGQANSFEDGLILLKEYLTAEINKQEKLKSGTCYISIVISREGKVEDLKVAFGKDDEFNKVALEIVKNIPDWKPGEKNGKPVNTSYMIEIKK